MEMNPLISLLPLALAALVALLGRKVAKAIKYIALGASLASLAIIILVALSGVQGVQSMSWFSIGGFSFSISTSTLPLNMLLLAIVGVMTPMIFIYAIGYMDVLSEQSRFYFEMCVFSAAMMLFAMSANFITMFIGWELLGITSYLLIGFWYVREGTARAARKAITTIIIGDVMMLFAMFLIWTTFHTFEFAAIIHNASTHSMYMEIALSMILVAAFTKSAQFPFSEWLADAMKGPTPVSAFLHSSTMVKAGVFLIAVLLPLYVSYNMLYVLLGFGIVTAFIGATNALTEMHIKRVLAYSTIEDLGLMFVALGTGSLIAAMMLFVVQTFYKALLFMSAGAMIKANGNEEDMGKVYSSPSFLKLTIPTVLAVASLAGLFPLSGFFGKAAVDASAGGSIAVYGALLIIGFLSDIYIFRWLFVPMHRRSDKRTASARARYKMLPAALMIPMYVLAFLIVAGTAAYFLLPTYLSSLGPMNLNIGITEIAALSTAFAIGLAISYVMFYKRRYSSIEERSPIYRVLHSSSAVNAAYHCLAAALLALASWMESLDTSAYGLIRDGGKGLIGLGNRMRKLENGSVNVYAAAFVIGVAAVGALIILVLK